MGNINVKNKDKEHKEKTQKCDTDVIEHRKENMNVKIKVKEHKEKTQNNDKVVKEHRKGKNYEENVREQDIKSTINIKIEKNNDEVNAHKPNDLKGIGREEKGKVEKVDFKKKAKEYKKAKGSREV